MPGIYVRETWFISLSYVSRGIIIWSITTNSLRLAIPVRLSPLRRTKTYPSVEGRAPPQSSKNRLNDVEAIVNVTCNDGLSHMHTIVFRRHGKVSGSLLMSGLITNQYVKSVTAGNHSILTLSKVPQPTAVRSYIRCTAVLFTIFSCTDEL